MTFTSDTMSFSALPPSGSNSLDRFGMWVNVALVMAHVGHLHSSSCWLLSSISKSSMLPVRYISFMAATLVWPRRSCHSWRSAATEYAMGSSLPENVRSISASRGCSEWARKLIISLMSESSSSE